MSFHRRCGSRIHLSNLNRTARRNINDFNHGIVLSAEPMQDDTWFQVRIDEKVSQNIQFALLLVFRWNLPISVLNMYIDTSMERYDGDRCNMC